ncbi:HIT family protein [Gorillibacterium massiliense]|uniref:HIT family protein n=1 Tax=Gorillibacterium massiliense TaxID=1280390 RepID=UPI0004B926D3|nr:HIT family protein [Gorillibacterium massiliense]
MYRECVFCGRDERLDQMMIEICDLSVSTLYLNKEQTYFGRCVVVLKDHQRELFQLSEETRTKFMNDIVLVAGAIEKAFQPDRINYGCYGDYMPHLHFHVVPKYKDGEAWGFPFELNGKQIFLNDEQYMGMIEKLMKYMEFTPVS